MLALTTRRVAVLISNIRIHSPQSKNVPAISFRTVIRPTDVKPRLE